MRKYAIFGGIILLVCLLVLGITYVTKKQPEQPEPAVSAPLEHQETLTDSESAPAIDMFDEQRASDLYDLTREIGSYYTLAHCDTTGTCSPKLPETLAELTANETWASMQIADPKHKTPYAYIKKGDNDFVVCGVPDDFQTTYTYLTEVLLPTLNRYQNQQSVVRKENTYICVHTVIYPSRVPQPSE